MKVLSDKERKRKLADLLERYHRMIEYQRNEDVQWNIWADEIELSSPTVLSQYKAGTRQPEGPNLVRLARYFMKNFNIDLYEELGIPAGGLDDPRIGFILDCLNTAEEDKIRMVMRILGGGVDTDDVNPNTGLVPA